MSQILQVAIVVVAGFVFVVRLANGLRQTHIRGRIGGHPAGQEKQR